MHKYINKNYISKTSTNERNIFSFVFSPKNYALITVYKFVGKKLNFIRLKKLKVKIKILSKNKEKHVLFCNE
jgi:hypothetical protein